MILYNYSHMILYVCNDIIYIYTYNLYIYVYIKQNGEAIKVVWKLG